MENLHLIIGNKLNLKHFITNYLNIILTKKKGIIHINMKNNFSGILEYNDDGQYVVGNVNLSQILDEVYYSNNNIINIKIYEGTKTLFIEDGYLTRRKSDIVDIYSYHVNSFGLEDLLFDTVGKYITVEVECQENGKYSLL